MHNNFNTARRDFLRQGSLLFAGSALVPSLAFDGLKSKAVLGIQLYSVRDDMGKDPVGTLQQLAKIGFTHVEHANYHDRKFYGHSPKAFKKLLKSMGMKMRSGHTVLGKDHWDERTKDFTDTWKWTVEDAAIAGQKYVISPWLDESYRKTHDDLKRYMEVFNKCGQLCQKSGMKFGYHNHSFEFNTTLGGERVYDTILKNTDPKLVTQQLDTGNLYNGGGIALDIVKQYPGRFELMHVKDEILSNGGDEKYESSILGQGIVNVRSVVDLGKADGTHHFIIEQESYQGKTPIACAKADYEVMKAWGY